MRVNVKAITVASHECGHFRKLLLSCRRQGFEPTVLGMGAPFRGYGYRLKLLWQYVLNACAPEDLVVHCDAFDTVFAGDLASLKLRFDALRVNLLVSAEKYCWPDAALAATYPVCHTPYRYLCAGLWMGYVGAVLGVCDALGVQSMPDCADDQREFTRLYVTSRGLIQLDNDCVVFQNLHESIGDLEFSGNISNRVTGTRPVVFHGQGLTDMSGVLIHLGLA
jgi:hypothetical protein